MTSKNKHETEIYVKTNVDSIIDITLQWVHLLAMLHLARQSHPFLFILKILSCLVECCDRVLQMAVNSHEKFILS